MWGLGAPVALDRPRETFGSRSDAPRRQASISQDQAVFVRFERVSTQRKDDEILRRRRREQHAGFAAGRRASTIFQPSDQMGTGD